MMEQHLEEFTSGGGQGERQQFEALNRVSAMLERAEAHFQQLVGDPHCAAAQRGHFPVGRLAAMVHSLDLLEDVAEEWVLCDRACPKP